MNERRGKSPENSAEKLQLKNKKITSKKPIKPIAQALLKKTAIAGERPQKKSPQKNHARHSGRNWHAPACSGGRELVAYGENAQNLA